MKDNSKYRDGAKVLKVIHSCITKEQLNYAVKYAELFCKKYDIQDVFYPCKHTCKDYLLKSCIRDSFNKRHAVIRDAPYEE